jgi:hypothetical protein
MIDLASTTSDVLRSILVAVGASALTIVGGGFFTYRANRRNTRLADRASSPAAVALAAQTVESSDQEVLHDILKTAVRDIASQQELSVGRVRGALFQREGDGSLRILAGQTVGFDSPQEEEIRIQLGESGVGEAAAFGEPVITTFRSPTEESTIVDPANRALIDPNLRWIIAVPVAGQQPETQWVLSIDGLIEGRTQDELRQSVVRLLYYRELLELLLRAQAGRGQKRQR